MSISALLRIFPKFLPHHAYAFSKRRFIEIDRDFFSNGCNMTDLADHDLN